MKYQEREQKMPTIMPPIQYKPTKYPYYQKSNLSKNYEIVDIQKPRNGNSLSALQAPPGPSKVKGSPYISYQANKQSKYLQKTVLG